MRIARTVTGRNTIVSFNGSYHGINDEVILRGTKKLTSVPAAAGIPPEAVKNMLVLDYGTAETLDIIRQRAHEIAAVMVEPVQSRRADFHPKRIFKGVKKNYRIIRNIINIRRSNYRFPNCAGWCTRIF